MSSHLQGLLWVTLSTTLIALGSLFQAHGVLRLPELREAGVVGFVRSLVGQPRWVLGWLLTQLGLGANIYALTLTQLSSAQAVHGLGLVVVALGARWVVGETVTPRGWIAMASVCAGVVALGLWPPSPGAGIDPWAAGILGGLLGASAVAAFLWGGAPGWFISMGAAASSVLGFALIRGVEVVSGEQSLLKTAARPAGLVVVAVIIAAKVWALVLQQLSFQRGSPTAVVTVFTTTAIVLPLWVDPLVFGVNLEWELLLPVALIIGGVVGLVRAQGRAFALGAGGG